MKKITSVLVWALAVALAIGPAIVLTIQLGTLGIIADLYYFGIAVTLLGWILVAYHAGELGKVAYPKVQKEEVQV